MINRFDIIRKHRIYRDFRWPSTLANFSTYNLIYGWNGTGKTTLSNLFRMLEKQKQIEGDFELAINGKKYSAAELAKDSAVLLQIRVFNEDFIRENVFTLDGSVVPIFVLGEQNIKKQKQITSLQQELTSKQEGLEKLQIDMRQREKNQDDYCIQIGKKIKHLLGSGEQNPYNSYNKKNYRQKVDKLLETKNLENLALGEQERNSLKKIIGSSPKQKLIPIEKTLPDLIGLTEEVRGVLAKTIVSQTIKALRNDPRLSEWVQEGLELHGLKNSRNTCLFCRQSLPGGRLSQLEGHFNLQYTSLLREIELLAVKVQGFLEDLKGIQIPAKASLYDHLAEPYSRRAGQLKAELTRIETVLRGYLKQLTEKRRKVFEPIKLAGPVAKEDNALLMALNKIIQQHNQETDDFQKNVNDARGRLEDALIADSLPAFMSKSSMLKAGQNKANKLAGRIKELTRSITSLEADIINHRQPAEELNQDLQHYLGHDSLRFEIRESGYQIMRKEQIATDLSEGEKTAIAFLYFLKSLNARDFDRSTGIVVIDDPISSLDNNALFHAFSFMKDRTQGVSQLFVLTHNFSFFRLVRNWFKHDRGISTPQFYMLKCAIINGSRQAHIISLDHLLRDYDSEYHYLFSLIYQTAHSGSSKLDSFYHIPNVARRLLENFLTFKQPIARGNFYRQLSGVTRDQVKISRIYNFLNSHSHNDVIDDPEHDNSILGETQQIMKDILSVIKEADESHYTQMVEIIKPEGDRYRKLG